MAGTQRSLMWPEPMRAWQVVPGDSVYIATLPKGSGAYHTVVDVERSDQEDTVTFTLADNGGTPVFEAYEEVDVVAWGDDPAEP